MNGRNRIGALAAAALALGACATGDGATAQGEPTPAQRKHRMLFGAEHAIHRVLEDARQDAAKLRAEFQVAVTAVPRSYRLNATDPLLEPYGAETRQLRHDTVAQAQAATTAKLDLLLKHYEAALWAMASKAGELEHGSDTGTRTGYQELDDKVEAAMLQIARAADVEEVEQTATFTTYDDVALDRDLREEMAGRGTLSLYKSAPIVGLFAPGQEGQAIAAVFVRAGIAGDVPLSFVQAVRRRVERAGIVVSESEWQLDPATPDGRGVVELRRGVDATRCLATDVCIPAVDTRVAAFRALWDHVLVSEYRTALQRGDTGEILATICWQVRWNVDFHGSMRVLVDKLDEVRTSDSIVPALLAAAPKQ